jgi:hypothetical protein
MGYADGIDLIITHMSRTITIKRNTVNMDSPYRGLLSNKTTMRIYYVLKVIQLDSLGNEVWCAKSDLTCLDLHKNDEKNSAIKFDSNVKYPLVLNLLIATNPLDLNRSILNNTTNNEQNETVNLV